MLLIDLAGREIPEEVAHKTDSSNEFPLDMWPKLGEAGCVYTGPEPFLMVLKQIKPARHYGQ